MENMTAVLDSILETRPDYILAQVALAIEQFKQFKNGDDLEQLLGISDDLAYWTGLWGIQCHPNIKNAYERAKYLYELEMREKASKNKTPVKNAELRAGIKRLPESLYYEKSEQVLQQSKAMQNSISRHFKIL